MSLYIELKIQPGLNGVLIPPHLRGGSMGPSSSGTVPSPQEVSSATSSNSNAVGASAAAADGASSSAVAAGHSILSSPPDVCSTAGGETLGAVGTA